MRKTNFLKIVCPRCRNQQIMFGKASLQIHCSSCNYLLSKTSGGKAKVRARVKEVL